MYTKYKDIRGGDMINKIINGRCEDLIKQIPDGSIDAILTDPPYLYLKNQKLDVPFDEDALFSEWFRVLKDGGLIALFGRGVALARWIVKLDALGFVHKEDMVWNKSYCSSPLMSLSRVHENFVIMSKGTGSINKVKVPYLEMKGHDLASMQQDIKRLCTTFNNPESLKAVEEFLANNNLNYSEDKITGIAQSGGQFTMDRCCAVANSFKNGMNEKSIIRCDTVKDRTYSKHDVNLDNEKVKDGDRSVNVAQSIHFGMNEKSIIKEAREHYNTIHPTQKPIALLNRILNLISKQGDTILDCFSGSGSTAVSCMKSQRKFIAFELDKEYFDLSLQRIEDERDLFTF